MGFLSILGVHNRLVINTKILCIMDIKVEDLKGGKFFGVTFMKRNGDERTMLARLGVKKGVKGIGMSYDPKEYNLLTVYSVRDKDFRTVNLNTVSKVVFSGKIYNKLSY